MSTARKITQTFNGPAEWGLGGGYFKLLSTVNPVDVELATPTGIVLTAASVEAGFYQRAAFSRVKITTGANEAVTFLVAPDLGGSDRFTGDVDLIDQATRQVGKVQSVRDPIVDAGEAFRGYQSPGASGGNYGHVQLMNPAGSGKIVYVDAIEVYVSTAMAGLLTLYNTALTAGNAPENCKSGGAAPSSLMRYTLNAAVLGTIIGSTGVPVGGESRRNVLANPIRLDAGKGLCVVGGVVNTGMNATFEFREVTA